MEVRDSTVARTAIAPSVRERLWGKSAGRCVLCARSVIDDTTFWHDINVGEVAHNVGASEGANSPRGDSELTAKERSDEENLLLLCHDCHQRIDSRFHRADYSVDFLRTKKAEHELRVREVTEDRRRRCRGGHQRAGRHDPARLTARGEAHSQIGAASEG